jgi:hypothetical protein
LQQALKVTLLLINASNLVPAKARLKPRDLEEDPEMLKSIKDQIRAA